MPVTRHLLQPTRRNGRAALDTSLFGLAPNGVYPATHVAMGAVSSYLAVSPLPAYRRFVFCGTFHRSPGVRVTNHSALWSSDFPLRRNRSDHAPAPKMLYFILPIPAILCSRKYISCYTSLSKHAKHDLPVKNEQTSLPFQDDR